MCCCFEVLCCGQHRRVCFKLASALPRLARSTEAPACKHTAPTTSSTSQHTPLQRTGSNAACRQAHGSNSDPAGTGSGRLPTAAALFACCRTLASWSSNSTLVEMGVTRSSTRALSLRRRLRASSCVSSVCGAVMLLAGSVSLEAAHRSRVWSAGQAVCLRENTAGQMPANA